jgi:hypothetical protein
MRVEGVRVAMFVCGNVPQLYFTARVKTAIQENAGWGYRDATSAAARKACDQFL